MSNLKMYELVITPHFNAQAKSLIKKNRSLKDHLKVVLTNFHKGNSTSLGRDMYKIRMQGLNKGKSGGYRLYIYLVEMNNMISPVTIYSKNEKENLTIKEINDHLQKVKDELIEIKLNLASK